MHVFSRNSKSHSKRSTTSTWNYDPHIEALNPNDAPAVIHKVPEDIQELEEPPDIPTLSDDDSDIDTSGLDGLLPQQTISAISELFRQQRHRRNEGIRRAVEPLQEASTRFHAQMQADMVDLKADLNGLEQCIHMLHEMLSELKVQGHVEQVSGTNPQRVCDL